MKKQTVWQTLLIVAMLWLANTAYAAEYKWVGDKGTAWPADADWHPITSLNDPNNGLARTQLDFVGDDSNPGAYWSADASYFYFRFRVQVGTVNNGTFSDTLTVLIDLPGYQAYSGSDYPDYAFAWDSNSNQNTKHGLEMQINSSTNSVWNGINLTDLDCVLHKGYAPESNCAATKGTNDINGPTSSQRTNDGYVRTLDGQSTANFGPTTFVDFAVSWSYLETYTYLARGQTWRFGLGSISNATDHNNINADVSGGADPGSSSSAGWSPALPTAVRETAVRVERDPAGNLVRWRTGHEVRNLGFNVYREGPQGLERLNPSLIGGSALLAGPNGTLTAGNSYSWWDPDGSPTDFYRVESIDLSGEREMHGPAWADATRDYGLLADEDRRSSPLLNRVPANATTITSSYAGQAVIGAGRASTYVGQAAPLAAGSPTISQQQRQWDIAAGTAVKIGVRTEGWYVIPRADLLAAGLPPNANPDLLHLYADGIELPILLQGARNKSFDSIAFYGAGLDTPATDTRVYWLTAGKNPGLRIPINPLRISSEVRPPASPTPSPEPRSSITSRACSLATTPITSSVPSSAATRSTRP